MSWPWRKLAPPARVPHTDAKVELQLQQIIGTRERITRAVKSITDYQEEIFELLRATRAMSELAAEETAAEERCARQISLNDERVRWLMAEMRTLEDSIVQAHELIQAIGKDLTSADLDFL